MAYKKMLQTVDVPRPDSFFNVLFKKKIVIPPYQRFYTWGKDLVLDLLEDIDLSIKVNKKIYLGTIIVKLENNGEDWKIIDGQQRILTLIIFLRVLLNSKSLSTSNKDIIKSWFKGVIVCKWEIDLNEQKRNEFFQNLIIEGEIVNFDGYKNQKYSEKIFSSFKIITEKINEKTPEQVNRTFFFLKDHVEIISIQLHEDADESDIFESINSKRVELNAADLIKNFVLSKSKNNSGHVLKKWEDFSGILGDDVNLLKFFEHYCDVLSSKDSISDTYKHFKDIFRRHHKKSINACMESLLKYARFYSLIKNGSKFKSNVLKEVNTSLECLTYLGFLTQIPLLLKILGLGVKSSSKNFLRILKTVEIVQFLYQEIDERSLPQEVKDFFYNLMWSINSKKDVGKVFASLNKKKMELSLEENKKKIAGLSIVTKKSQKIINYILYRIFKNSSSSILHVSLKTIDSSIEHVFPQTGKSINKEFNQYWKKIFKEDISEDSILAQQLSTYQEKGLKKDEFYYNNIIQSLGNLSLLSPTKNASVSNNDFKTKKKQYLKSENNNALFKFILKQNKWNAKSVRDNALNLTRMYLGIFD